MCTSPRALAGLFLLEQGWAFPQVISLQWLRLLLVMTAHLGLFLMEGALEVMLYSLTASLCKWGARPREMKWHSLIFDVHFLAGCLQKPNHPSGWKAGERHSNRWHPWTLLRSRSRRAFCQRDVIPSAQQPAETGSPARIFIGHGGLERLSVLTKVTSPGSLGATSQPSPGSRSHVPSLLPSDKNREIVK